ncbi:MAG: hypothetical protein ACRDOW_00045 [Nocardioidaceae bacterium]
MFVAAATCGAVGLTGVPANAMAAQPQELAMARLAKPPTKLGAVKNLKAEATKPGTSYVVKATWDRLTGANAYEASMIDAAGTVLAKSRVTETTFSAQTKLGAGSVVRVRVVPMADKRRGTATTTSVTLPDLTAPVGKYSVTLDRLEATVTEDSLDDDVTTRGEIVREIDWGQGDGFESWDSGTTTRHTYPELGIWYPKLRLTDKAGNKATLSLQTVVTGDETAPTGTFATAPQKAWAKLTRVVLTQVEIGDNLSKDEDIKRLVDWKDGSAPVEWSTGSTLTHRYTVGGSFTPTVTLVDDAGNERTVDSSTVQVSVDATAPKATVKKPRSKAAVRAWRTLRGTAKDGAGTGVRTVLVKVVEKRSGVWFAYRAPGKRWVRGGATKAAAMKRARPAVRRPGATGTWAVKVAKLRKGVLVVRATAVDKVGNQSRPAVVRQRLSR